MGIESKPKKETLDRRQQTILRRAREISQLLIADAQLVEDRRQGFTIEQLAQKYFPEPLDSRDTPSMYITAVRMALEELLDPEERLALGKTNIAIAAGRSGNEQFETGQGMFKRDAATVSADASRSGKIGGQRAYELKAGVHGLSAERRSEVAQKAGTASGKRTKELSLGFTQLPKEEILAAVRKSHESRGIIPFTGEIRTTEFGEIDEQVYIRSLKEAADFSNVGGWNTLADKVNAIFKHDRPVKAVQDCYYNSRKRK